MADQTALQRAIQLACDQVALGGGPFGAIIVFDGRIVGEGMNQVTLWQDPTAHAEIVAIREACRILRRFELAGCILYSSCEPCPMCLSAARWARIDAIYYAASRHDAAHAGFDDAKLYAEFRKPIKQQMLAAKQMIIQNRTAPFELWLRKLDRVDY